MSKCKKCNRNFKKKRSWQKFCTENCRVNHKRGLKSKWQKILEEEIKELGPNLRKSVKFSINQKESVKRRIMWPFFKL